MAKATNGNQNVFRWFAVGGVAAVILGWIWNAAIISRDLKVNVAEDLVTHNKLQDVATQSREDIISLKSDILYIKVSVDEIKKELKRE